MGYYISYRIVYVFGFRINLIVVFKYYLYIVSVYDKLFDVIVKRSFSIPLYRLNLLKFNPAIK